MIRNQPLPVKSNGQIDDDELFKLAITKLKMSLSEYQNLLEEYTFHHFNLLIEGYKEERKDFFTTLAMSVSVGYAQAKTGKEIKMFKEEGKGEKVQKVSADKRKEH